MRFRRREKKGRTNIGGQRLQAISVDVKIVEIDEVTYRHGQLEQKVLCEYELLEIDAFTDVYVQHRQSVLIDFHYR